MSGVSVWRRLEAQHFLSESHASEVRSEFASRQARFVQARLGQETRPTARAMRRPTNVAFPRSLPQHSPALCRPAERATAEAHLIATKHRSQASRVKPQTRSPRTPRRLVQHPDSGVAGRASRGLEVEWRVASLRPGAHSKGNDSPAKRLRPPAAPRPISATTFARNTNGAKGLRLVDSDWPFD